MKKLVGLILLIIGIYLCYVGHQRHDSVAGAIDSASTTVANKVTGEPHTTDATWYYVGGGVLILIGVFSLLGGRRRP